MKKRKQVFPVYVWLLGLLLCPFLWTANAAAQAQSKLRLLVADCVNRSSRKDANIAAKVTEAIYVELTKQGAEQYTVISKQQMQEASARLGLKEEKEGKPVRIRPKDTVRLALELNVDAVAESEALSYLKNGKYWAVVKLEFREVISKIPINGGSADAAGKTLDQAVTDAVMDSVRWCQQRRLIFAVVEDRRGDRVTLGQGTRVGMKEGHEIYIVHKAGEERKLAGKLRVVKVFPDHSEAEVIHETESILKGDAGRVKFEWSVLPHSLASPQ